MRAGPLQKLRGVAIEGSASGVVHALPRAGAAIRNGGGHGAVSRVPFHPVLLEMLVLLKLSRSEERRGGLSQNCRDGP